MALDDERLPWPAAEAMERGENPQPDRLPENKAAARLAGVIGTHLQPAWLTNAALEDVCRKVIAHRGFFRTVFDELDADPKRLPEPHRDLRETRVNEVESVDWWAEHVHHLKREYEDALAIYERVRSGRIAEYDPDARDRDREDDRLREERQDATAADAAPSLGAAS